MSATCGALCIVRRLKSQGSRAFLTVAATNLVGRNPGTLCNVAHVTSAPPKSNASQMNNVHVVHDPCNMTVQD